MHNRACVPGRKCRGEVFVLCVIILEREADLAQVVNALRPPRCLASVLDCGQKHCCQQPDNGYDNKDLK
jgi:hypothetical protein